MNIIFKKENIPNYLCILRMLMVFVFLIFMFSDFPKYRLAAAATYFAACATDVLDGWLARRNGWVSRIGKILDPVADKLFHMAVLVSFAIKSCPAVVDPAIYISDYSLAYLMIKSAMWWSGEVYGKFVARPVLLVCSTPAAGNIEEYRLTINSIYTAILLMLVIIGAWQNT